MRAWICAAVAAGALAAPAADAATLSVSERIEYTLGGTNRSIDLTYAAAPGEANEVVVLRSWDRHLAEWLDLGAPIYVAPGSELPAPAPDTSGCLPVRMTGTLLGDDAALGEATCLRTDPVPDPTCQFNPLCQSGVVSGFDVVHVRTGDRDDVVRALDGVPERIDCGSGLDRVLADPEDVLIGCEIRGA